MFFLSFCTMYVTDLFHLLIAWLLTSLHKFNATPKIHILVGVQGYGIKMESL